MSVAALVQTPGWNFLVAPVHLVIGAGLGVLYFGAIWHSANMLAGRARPIALVVAMAARFAVLAAVLTLAGLEGAAPLLATAFGVMAGRFLVLRRVRGASA